MSNKIPKHDRVIKSIGHKVQYCRKVKGLTQEELADKINKTVDTISNIERGVFGVKIETLFDISEALEIELYDLFTDIKSISKKPSKKINNLIQKISSQESEVVSAIEKIVNEVCKVVR